ncbi:MAG TPA: hypothetical protein VHG08_29400 [Longimicrobium sp.]|nr:hypothetical protein [Longimicrobium sp.]
MRTEAPAAAPPLSPPAPAPARHRVPAFVVWLPVVHAAADVTTNYFPAGVANTGSARAVVVAVFLLYFLTRRITFPRSTLPLAVFLGYVLLRSLMSTDPGRSLSDFSKVLLSMSMLVVGFHYIRTLEAFQRLNRATLAAAFLVLAQFAVAQVFKLGESVYVDDSVYLGGALASTAYYLSAAVVLTPVLLPSYRRRAGRVLAALVLGLAVLAMVVLLKRAALAGALLGFLTYILVAGRWGRAARYAAVAGTLLVVSSPVYLPVLMPRVEVRFSEKQSIERQARYRETLVVRDEFLDRGFKHAVVGTEMFNFAQYYGVDRQLHIDFNILLHGGGLAAVLLYLWLALSVLREHGRYYALGRRFPYARELRGVFLALLALALVVSFSYSITLLGYRSVLFLYLGALLRLQSVLARAAAPPSPSPPPPPRGAPLPPGGPARRFQPALP